MSTMSTDSDDVPSPVTASDISRRAFEKWTARASPGDDGLQDWIEAEAELVELRALSHQVQVLQQQLADQLAAFETTQSRLSAEHEVARILADAPSLAQAAGPILQCLCHTLRWCVGVMWSVDRSGGVLVCMDVYYLPDVDLVEFARETRARTFSRGEGLPGLVWDTQSPLVIQDVSAEGAFTRAEAAAGNLSKAVCFPILSGTEVLGVMEFFSCDSVTADDGLAEMMWSVSTLISNYIDRRTAEDGVRRQQQERHLAGEIQQRLLPKRSPAIAGYEICGRCMSALDVGGDCFDYLPLRDANDEYLGVLIADASGHNVGAALVVTEIRSDARVLGMATANLGGIFQNINRRIAGEMESVGFTTALLVRLAPDCDAIAFANAGHWPGVVFDPTGRVRATLDGSGYPLGIDADSTYEMKSTTVLNDGELLLLFTDGAIEACSADGELFGRPRLLDVVREYRSQPLGQILDAVFGEVVEFTAGAGLRDDATIVLIRRKRGVQPAGCSE